MTHRRTPRSATPNFLELHAGCLHLIIERVPYRLFAILGSLASALGSAAWITGR
ncbi:hypothetical protein P3T36_007731 [Kitasatospora sp. MAP12-15]|uniref:hypothetical protein n=1 Tax=unclassified Kitasatospora TaxID=2633591 RepID=UPI00247418B9|nr:hypothetical protein [Kitasatospora sp. MAP12-44]MDH6115605.1 hypothetical protein [Kitasatospora sp. MAP12-44]